MTSLNLIGRFLIIFWTGALYASSDNYQSHQSIRAAVHKHILGQLKEDGAEAQISVGKLDSRLRLARCDQPLVVTTPSGKENQARQTAGVSCQGGKPWTIYLSAKVSLMKQVLVASRALTRGSAITKKDLQLKARDITRLHQGFLEEPAEALGKTLKRGLRKGKVITPRLIAAPLMVKKGSRITILADTPGIKVRMAGKALASGTMGDRIRVRNQGSKRELEAIVTAPGVVKVLF